MIKQIKKDMLEARKNRSSFSPFYALLLSEIEKIGKNNGNRETTSDEAIIVIKKLKSTLETLPKDDKVLAELEILSKYLPEMVSEEEVLNFLESQMPDNIGNIMKKVKQTYGATADMRLVSKLYKELNE